MAVQEYEADPWEKTPRWSPRALFWPMRRWAWETNSLVGYHDGNWEYATYKQCARIVLEESYG